MAPRTADCASPSSIAIKSITPPASTRHVELACCVLSPLYLGYKSFHVQLLVFFLVCFLFFCFCKG